MTQPQLSGEPYDLIVIGSGPAGRRAAIQAAKLNKRVLVVERGRRVGGVSVHTGTIPSKTLRETVLNLSGWRERGFYGRAYRARQNISAEDLRKRLHMTLDHEVEVLEHQFARNNVETARGAARFIDPHTITVTGEGVSETYAGRRFLIAVGTRPYRPAHIGFDGENILDSDEILDLQRIPRQLVVVGASVVGVEYASIFSALDVKVTMVEPNPNLLPFLDRELAEEFVHDLRDRGVVMRLGCKVVSAVADGSQNCLVALDDGRELRADMVLFSAGREGAVGDLGLEACGLECDARGRLVADKATFQTGVEHIYAAGDIVGFPSLASTSMEQGRIAACHAFGEPAHAPPEFFPYGIYSVPEISTVGMTEEQVRAEAIPYECGVARFRETSRGHIMGISTGFMKMIFARDTRRLLGVHIVGEGATELIHIGQAVVNLNGGLDYFVENTFNYPTLAEAYKVAALDAWNRMPRAAA
ncbi:Si-specific NAD(P)(+) transhydrogenase [Phenylobacterium sp.]|uniref:Si-specific NAD(P)(+) transhydrogenase n=1 Tax=Phenylobacterium sp. TaxID=1871053 RepID=UPI002736BB5E|nr:Si-specific NAD(P)(+) transhydrogenase [Phenylobacterium sp.]MDP3661063.1 Si-specific NAD(P)(+) transhydrogenase [Phenylobacterium sp.]